MRGLVPAKYTFCRKVEFYNCDLRGIDFTRKSLDARIDGCDVRDVQFDCWSTVKFYGAESVCDNSTAGLSDFEAHKVCETLQNVKCQTILQHWALELLTGGEIPARIHPFITQCAEILECTEVEGRKYYTPGPYNQTCPTYAARR